VESVEFKVCTKCKQNHPLSNYWKQSKAKDGLNTWCKTCISIGMREHARKRKREVIDLLGGKCSVCNGTFHQAAYDFHHKNPTEKEGGIAKLLQSYSVQHPKVQQELNKCILICSNCHRTLHATET
jgi:predicted HNH restriction endonuclease